MDGRFPAASIISPRTIEQPNRRLERSECEMHVPLCRREVLVAGDAQDRQYVVDRLWRPSDERRLHLLNVLGGNLVQGLSPTRGIRCTLKADPDHNSGQMYYSGRVKPSEVRHDASRLRMVRQVETELARERSRLQRVVLDDELKGQRTERVSRRDQTVSFSARSDLARALVPPPMPRRRVSGFRRLRLRTAENATSPGCGSRREGKSARRC